MFTSNDIHEVIVPYGDVSVQKIVVTDQKDNFASLCEFYRHNENYVLDAGIHVDREMLLPGKLKFKQLPTEH